MQPELNSCEKAFAHMLYLRLKLTFHKKNLRVHGQHMRAFELKFHAKKLIVHGLHLQFHVKLQPNDLITMRMRLKLKSHKKNSKLIDDPCN